MDDRPRPQRQDLGADPAGADLGGEAGEILALAIELRVR